MRTHLRANRCPGSDCRAQRGGRRSGRDSPASPTSPIACTLGADDFKARLAWVAKLNDAYLREHRQGDLQLELVYAPEARDLAYEMVRREQACCAFLTFEVAEEEGALRVVISAPEAAREAAEALFEPFRSKTADQAAR